MALEICVKAGTGAPDQLGDCPFCQRVLLTLEEKNIPYTTKLVDLGNKPQWFLDISPEGKVPVINIDGKWVADSDVIVRILEEKYPESSLVPPPEFASAGSTLFSPFVKFLLNKDPKAEDETKQAFLKELKTLDGHLQANGPHIAGPKVTSIDLSLVPKLYHIDTTVGHFKNFNAFDGLVHVNNYVGLWFQSKSFKATAATKDLVIAGWSKKVNGA
ncbi:hypothetical protein MLD38_038127 [Melastoma candidum]|uniref:Uncharacterized protein n=1 Tax=Melastoma candidum TaxID=119954 RepID=A0ACB9KYT2_9MYRT|nr:hypothetical protein MLD38_038127 [Melastoma candidum]